MVAFAKSQYLSRDNSLANKSSSKTYEHGNITSPGLWRSPWPITSVLLCFETKFGCSFRSATNVESQVNMHPFGNTSSILAYTDCSVWSDWKVSLYKCETKHSGFTSVAQQKAIIRQILYHTWSLYFRKQINGHNILSVSWLLVQNKVGTRA